MLDGHQAIFKKLKATSISLNKTFITPQGDVRVWVNHHLERNDISGEILNTEPDIVKRILNTIALLPSNNYPHNNNLSDFSEYANTAMQRSGNWHFSYLRALIRSYMNCLRLKLLPIVSQQCRPDTQYSHIQNPVEETPINKKVRSSLMHNGEQSLHSSHCLRRYSQPMTNATPSLSHFPISTPATSKNTNPNPMPSSTPKPPFDRPKPINPTNPNSTAPEHAHLGPIPASIKLPKALKSNNFLHSNSISSKEHKKVLSINDTLLNKTAFAPLPEILDEYCLSPEVTPRIDIRITKQMPRKAMLSIASQYDVIIEKNADDGLPKPSKGSSISTNHTSILGYQLPLPKKLKESHLTLSISDK
jgi:hypothetical protein